MKHNLFSSVLLASSFIFTLTANAQMVNQQQYHHNASQQVRHYQAPKPMTEDLLKKRLDTQIGVTKRQMAFDKKRADDYAKNFAHYQKQQANALQQMMAQVEKQHQFTIKRLEIQKEYILKQFSKYQVAKDSKN